MIKRGPIGMMCSRVYCFQVARTSSLRVRLYCSHASQKTVSKTLNASKDAVHLRWVELGKNLSKKTVDRIRATANTLWENYEEFVGLKEVQEAQLNVNEVMCCFWLTQGCSGLKWRDGGGVRKSPRSSECSTPVNKCADIRTSSLHGECRNKNC